MRGVRARGRGRGGRREERGDSGEVSERWRRDGYMRGRVKKEWTTWLRYPHTSKKNIWFAAATGG